MRLIDAAEEVRKVARFYRAMETVAEALTTIGSLEQAKSEAEGALAATAQNAAVAKGELEAMQAEVAAAKDEAKKIRADAAAKAAKKLADADEECDKRIKAADVLASERIAAAENYQTRLDELKKEVAAAQAEFESLTSRIAETKAQIAKLLGS